MGLKKTLLVVLSLLKSACRAGTDFMNDACFTICFLKARGLCAASDNAVTGAVTFFPTVTLLYVNFYSTITCYPYSELMKPRMLGKYVWRVGNNNNKHSTERKNR